VFLNLFINAAHAMPSGGTLSVRTACEQRDGQTVEVVARVSDTGDGMPQDVLRRVFEPFFTTKGQLGGSDVPGTGLGLAVSHGIVTAHGGTIVAFSEVGEGTTFELRFPVHACTEPGAGRASAGAQGDTPPAAAAGQRVLIVEDEPELREVLGQVLRGSGYSVHTAEGAEQGIELLDSQQFDLVISDLLMPGGGGKTVLRHAGKLAGPVPVLIVTGRLEAGEVEEAEALGAAGVLHKPLSGREILAAAAGILGPRE